MIDNAKERFLIIELHKARKKESENRILACLFASVFGKTEPKK